MGKSGVWRRREEKEALAADGKKREYARSK
jgi:hypothetical protein